MLLFRSMNRVLNYINHPPFPPESNKQNPFFLQQSCLANLVEIIYIKKKKRRKKKKGRTNSLQELPTESSRNLPGCHQLNWSRRNLKLGWLGGQWINTSEDRGIHDPGRPCGNYAETPRGYPVDGAKDRGVETALEVICKVKVEGRGGRGRANQPSLIARPPIGGQHFRGVLSFRPRERRRLDDSIQRAGLKRDALQWCFEGRLTRFERVAIMTGGGAECSNAWPVCFWSRSIWLISVVRSDFQRVL